MSSVDVNRSACSITGLLHSDTTYHGDFENINLDEYTLDDVIYLAQDIVSEITKIRTSFGDDVDKDLSPNILKVLLLLEDFTRRNSKENEEKDDLKMRIHSLEYEKIQRNNERDKFERELEEIEEKWQKESETLNGKVNKLKEENKRLNEFLSEQNTKIPEGCIMLEQKDLDFIEQIKGENFKLKEINRYKDKELTERLHETEAVI